MLPTVDGLLADCKKTLVDAGIDIEQIKFTQFDEDPTSFYFRDNGPNVMVNDKGETLVVNPSWSFYGRYGKNDGLQNFSRLAGVHAAVTLGCTNIIDSDMVSEGGDREFNGAGILMAVEDTEVRKRNPEYTKEQIEAEYKKIWNVEKIIWLPQPLFDDDDFTQAPLDFKEDARPSSVPVSPRTPMRCAVSSARQDLACRGYRRRGRFQRDFSREQTPPGCLLRDPEKRDRS